MLVLVLIPTPPDPESRTPNPGPRTPITVVVLAVCLGCLTPAPCFALREYSVGNERRSAENYADWPGLVEAVNAPSRILQLWHNGRETLSYSGDVASLNRVLKKFSQTKAPKLNVVLRPGPGEFITLGRVNKHVDWSIEVVGGIARDIIEQRQLTAVQDLQPTLTIYVTEHTDLDTIDIPPQLTLLQLADLEARYFAALQAGDEPVRIEAGRQLELLEKDAHRDAEARRAYKTQLNRIERYMEQHRKSSP